MGIVMGIAKYTLTNEYAYIHAYVRAYIHT